MWVQAPQLRAGKDPYSHPRRTDHLRLEEPIGPQIVHQVVGVTGPRVANGTLPLDEKHLLAAWRRLDVWSA